MKRRRILILTDSIAPPAYAPRIVSLTRYLSARGEQVVVFSDCEKGVQPFTDACGQWENTAYYQTGNQQWKYIADKLFGQRERAFQTYIETTVNVADFDVIFCSTYYYFPLQATYRLARKYNKPFVVDLRDIAEQWGDIPYRTHSLSPVRWVNTWLHRAYTALNIRKRNRVLKAANQVITISPWHQQFLERITKPVHLIYNGFDEQEFYPNDLRSDTFIISYTGKIYDLSFRDPRLLFEAMQQLIANQQIDTSKIQIRFHIDQASIIPLQQLVAQYGLTDNCRIEGYIPKSELLPLLHRSSILLVLTSKSTPQGAHGIMGTKIYEAMGVGKPVLCVRSDEECMEQVITQTNAGLAGKKVEEVADFILAKYAEWQQNGFTRQPIQNQQIFSRQYQSSQIEALL